MRIAGAASAFPQYVYGQQAVVTALKEFWGDRLERPELLERLHARSGVERRHFVMSKDEYAAVDTFGKANGVWIEKAQELGVNAICRAITPLGIAPSDINALYVASVTGIASPSLDAKLINAMGLSPNLKRVPIFGLGCVAGAAGIARAADYVRGFPDQIAAVLCVELCSLTWRRDDVSAANLVATGLFGDGAAAAIIAGAHTRLEGPQIVDTRSVFYPDTEEVMGWDISENGFRIVLSPDVPRVVREHLGRDVDSFLSDHGLTRSDIGSWIIHTGGPKVLEAVQDALELPDGALDASWESLRQVGNLSSASVLCVLQDFLAHRRGAPGTYSVLAAMGPGFCSEVILLRW